MTDITIRKLEGDEKLAVMYNLNAYAFHASPPLMSKDEWQEPVRQREGVTYFALFEDGAAVAGAAGTTMTQQVRGSLFAANGIWAVATAPGSAAPGLLPPGDGRFAGRPAPGRAGPLHPLPVP